VIMAAGPSAPAPALHDLAAAHGGSIERALDGTIIAVFHGDGQASDLARRAARCALELQGLLSTEAPTVLVTGRGHKGGSGAVVGDAIDRAGALLGGNRSASGIRIDDVTRGLLDGAFDIEEGEVAILVGERELGRDARRLLGKATPFVGRERELRGLSSMFA